MWMGWVAAILIRMVSIDTVFICVAGHPTAQTNVSAGAGRTAPESCRVPTEKEASVRPPSRIFFIQSFLVGLPAFSPTATNTNAWVRTLCCRGGCVEQMGVHVALGKWGLRWASGGCVEQVGVALGKWGLR